MVYQSTAATCVLFVLTRALYANNAGVDTRLQAGRTGWENIVGLYSWSMVCMVWLSDGHMGRLVLMVVTCAGHFEMNISTLEKSNQFAVEI